MRGYGQFCPLALTMGIVGERWTLLVLRELMLGATRFNDIQRGVPRMSPSLLALRLKALEQAGIVARGADGGYALTEAGVAMGPAVEALANWGKTWLPATLSAADCDPDLILWDMHRRLDLDRLPEDRTVIRFDFPDMPAARRLRWILASREGAQFCITDPGFAVDLDVSTDSRTFTWMWYGDIPLRRAIADGRIALTGPPRLRRAFPSWLLLNFTAGIERRFPLEAAG